ncbi:MAG TPA: VWA domain-containing protein [Vicinamibacterales bacterium]|nr:VWA domain-containing protein [Vicinamibacterales bacterium]
MKVLAVAVSLAMLAARQEPQPRRPTFKSTVDLVPVDVSVVDKNGRPVSDLTPQEFTLSVDGKPRRIASAEFISIAGTAAAAPARAAEYSTNAGAAGGRLIMLVIDAENIGIGRGKTVFEAARRFVGTLNPADRVALVVLPNVGPQTEFTTNHALVQSLLAKVVGRATEEFGPRRIGLSDALALQGNDRTAIRDIVARECGADPGPTLVESCLQRMQGEGGQLLMSVRERSRNALVALRGLFDRMDTGNTPKTIVLLSEGMLLDRDLADISWIGTRASAAHIILYVLQMDSSESDASSQRLSSSQTADKTILKHGLDQLAFNARGEVFRIFGDADFAFQRLGRELSGYYLLSFEPESGDRDGTPHRIKIDVRRPQVELRARREFTVGPPVALTTDELVRQALRSPILAADIPLKLTTYTFQDPASSRLKILLAVEIDRSMNPRENVSLGYVMLDDMGQPGAGRLQRTVPNPVDAVRRVQQWVGAAVAPPGNYTVKVAVVDDSGRRGSVERTITARLSAFGQLHATDLLLADNMTQNAGDAPPPVAADLTGDELHTYFELLSEAPEQLTNASVVLEVAKTETGQAIESAPARLQAAEMAGGRRRTAEAGVPIGLLPPGEYVVRAVISVSGRKVGQVVRPFRVSRAGPLVAARGAAASPLEPAPPIAFASRIDVFDKSAVLTPQVLSFFLDRFSAGAAADAVPLRPAIEHARAGRLDEALQGLKGAADDRLAAVFLRGLAALSSGDLKNAEARFSAALKMDSEFLPAAFYLGACHAAAGRDRDAAAAWQTALITESNAPFVYTLLGDALLRLRDTEQAVDVLTAARTLWPANDDVGIRLATALVRSGRHAEAVKILLPYLDAHPADADGLFLALRSLYETRAANGSIETRDADKARFTRYADAYAAAGGSRQAVVNQWRKAFGSQ